MSTAAADAFAASRSRFDALTGWLTGDQAGGLDHAELESMLAADGRELLRQLLQDHLDLRAVREERLGGVADEAGVPRRAVETGHPRGLTTVFGAVTVTRTAYRRRGHANLHPADAALNLPAGRHSHGLRRLACVEATRGSFDDTLQAVERATGQKLAKRQAEQLVHAAAVDVDAFYASRCTPAGVREQVLALSADGKGIVMRPDSLRPATQRAAKTSRPKLGSRLSKGEKRNRKRLAEVCAVFDVTPRPRTAADIMTTTSDGDTDDPGDAATTPAPAVTNKWLKASVTADAATVIHDMFDEAERRDPDHERTWVALVDGNNHQIDRLTTEAAARGVDLAIVVDFIHALEYLWKAAWSFHDEADPAAEQWVHDKAVAVLNGHAARVAADIRRAAAERE
ncbi:MAG: ISKra4 family transposase, partial [Pseudonocardiaceae bacterium]